MATKFGSKKETKEVTVTVKAISKTGSILGTDAIWYSPSKFAKDLPVLERDKTYVLKIQENGNFKNIMAVEAVKTNVKSQEAPKAVNKPFSVPAVRKERDFDAEARGKSRCTLFAAALQSPALKGLDVPEEVIVVATQLAEAGMKYTFDDKPVMLPDMRQTVDGIQDGTSYDENEAATKVDVEDSEDNPLDSL